MIKRNKKVLIIDDTPEDFKFLKEWAESMNFIVLPADDKGFDTSGKTIIKGHEKIISAIKSNDICNFVTKQIDANYKNIELILCDIMLGSNYSGGNEVVKHIRNHKVKNFPEWTSRVPIYGVTQYEALLSDIIKDGADDVFTKTQLKNKNHEKSIRRKISKSVEEFEKYCTKKEIVNNKKVFIVHGHNDAIKQEVARTLEHLKLKPIILHEQPNKGRTLIEKFEANGSDVGFAIILLTADDVGRLNIDKTREKDNKPRARQNVVFEMGYFMSLLSRSHVVVLYEENVEKPSDISGILYIPYNDAWKLELVKELKACGYNVSADDL